MLRLMEILLMLAIPVVVAWNGTTYTFAFSFSVLGLVLYLTSNFLTHFFISRRAPETIQNSTWELTAGLGIVPKWVSAMGLYGMGFIPIGFLIALLLFFGIIQNKNDPIEIVPGQSIAGVMLGMSREEVVSLMGEPVKEISPNEVEQLAQSGGLIGGPVSGKAPQITFLFFHPPNLTITLHNIQGQDKVYAIQLTFNEFINVQGYDFLQFKYLSDEEIGRLGEPSHITRDKEMEKEMMAKAPDGKKLEYYMFDYRSVGLALSLVFDLDRKESNKNYIYLHAIAVVAYS